MKHGVETCLQQDWCAEYAALELIELLMEYEVKNAILEGLVSLLRPTIDVVRQQMDIFNGQCLKCSQSSSLKLF